MEAHAVPLPVSDELLAVIRRGGVVDAVALGCRSRCSLFRAILHMAARKTMLLPELEQGRVRLISQYVWTRAY